MSVSTQQQTLESPLAGRPQPEAAELRRSLWRRLASGQITLDDVWLLAIPLLTLFSFGLTNIQGNDFWWHLRTGQIIAESGRIPTVDLFTFTRSGQPWTNQAWLSQLLFYWLHRAGGLPLVLLVHMGAMAVGYSALVLAGRRAGVRTLHATLGAIGAMALGLLSWGIRPQTFSFACFGLLVWLIETHRVRGGRVLWGLPLLFVLWVNLHGGFVFGLGLLGLYTLVSLATTVRQNGLKGLASRRSRTLLAATIASVLALSLTPSGPMGMVDYVLGFFRSSTTMDLNVEFMALSVRQPDGIFFCLVVLLLGLLVYVRQLRLPAYWLVALAVFGLFTLYTRRVAPWFGMVAAPVLAAALAGRGAEKAQARPARLGKPLVNNTFVVLLALLALSRLPWLWPYWPADPVPEMGLSLGLNAYVDTQATPVDATAALCDQADSHVRLFNEMGYGSYLAWACPQIPVFIDTRVELYPQEMWQDYVLVVNGIYNWEEILQGYGVNTLFVQKHGQERLVAAARATGCWQVRYEDENAIILRRVAPSENLSGKEPNQ